MTPRLVTWAADWDRILAGTAPAERTLTTCPQCGGLRRASAGPHAPRYVDGRRVDCRFVEVAR